MATLTRNRRREARGRPAERQWAAWLGGAGLAVALVGAAGVAEAYPLPGLAALLPIAALCGWYRLRINA
jgi:hypothetical protein